MMGLFVFFELAILAIVVGIVVFILRKAKKENNKED